MDSTVKARPNHYEILGLSPTADSDEITRAFARQFGGFRPQAFGDLAFASLAYETLRDPIKRRAYDQSIGITPMRRIAPAGSVGAHFIPAVSASPVEKALSVDPAPQLAPKPAPELEMASAIAASLDETAVAVTKPGVSPSDALEPESFSRLESISRGDLQGIADRALNRAAELRFDEADDKPTDWKRTGIVIAALVAVAAIPGAVLGLWSGNGGTDEAQAETPRNTITVPLGKRPANIAQALPAPAPAVEDPRAEQPVARAEERLARTAATPTVERSAEDSLPESESSAETAPHQAIAEAASVETTVADMPLPRRVIARTIGSIGYACGEVASTAPVEGAAPGVFKVTCTSGHSYRATPIRGRYHFRRLGSR